MKFWFHSYTKTLHTVTADDDVQINKLIMLVTQTRYLTCFTK